MHFREPEELPQILYRRRFLRRRRRHLRGAATDAKGRKVGLPVGAELEEIGFGGARGRVLAQGGGGEKDAGFRRGGRELERGNRKRRHLRTVFPAAAAVTPSIDFVCCWTQR